MLSSGVGIQVFVQRMGSFVVGLASRRAGFVLVRNAGPYVLYLYGLAPLLLSGSVNHTGESI